MRQAVVLHLLLILAVAGCESNDAGYSDYTVIGGAEGAPDSCRPERIAERLAQLSKAVSAKEPTLVSEYFRGGPFEWYSMTEAATASSGYNHFVAYAVGDLDAYFLERFEQDEAWKLVELHVNGWEPRRGIVHFGPVNIRRTADDLAQELGGTEKLTTGKGAYHCASETFIVMSLGMNT